MAASGEAILFERGERRYVAVGVEDCVRLQSCALEAALRELRQDLAAERFVVEGARDHIRRLEELP